MGWDKFVYGWLRLRSAGLWALSDAARFLWSVAAGSVIVLATSLITWASGDGSAALLALLGIPVGIAGMFFLFSAAHLVGWGGQWHSSYRPYLGFESKRLYLGGADDDMFEHGVRCVVKGPSGTAVRERTYVTNGFEFPGEFPALEPLAPGKYRAMWYARLSPLGRWWYLTRLDFVPESSPTISSTDQT